MNRAISPGIYALLLTFVAGLWIVISPFVLEHQPAGAGWTRETVNNVAAGALLIGVSLLGVFLYLALALRDAVRAANERRLAEAAASEDRPAGDLPEPA